MIAVNSYSQIQWHHVNGPNGARVNCIAQNANGDIFEGNDFSGGLYKLAEGANKWSQILSNKTINDIIIRNNEIFLSAGDYFMHSPDNGNSWDVISPFSSILPIAIGNNDTIYASSFYLNYSVNNGQTWTQTAMPSSEGIAVDANGTVFTSSNCEFGIFRSYNSGLTYTQVLSNNQNFSSIGINSNNEIFTGAWTYGGGIFKSMDGGNSWLEIDSDFTNKIICYLVIDSNDYIYATTSDGVLHISRNGGSTWSNYPLNVNSPTEFFHDEIHHKFLLGTYSYGVYISEDSIINWSLLSDSLNNTFIWSIIQNINGDLYCCTDITIFKSVNNGDTWEKLNSPITTNNIIYKILFNSLGHIFVCTDNFGIFRSVDDGVTWQNLNNGITTHTQMLDMTINNNDDIFVSDLNYGIFRSTNDGNNWQELDTINVSKSLQALAITKSNSVLVGGFCSSKIYRSTDNGDTWQQSNFYGSDVQKFVVLPDSSIIASGYNGIYISYDDGINWTYKNYNYFNDIVADVYNILYGVSSSTFSISFDHGYTWSVVSNIPNIYNPNALFLSNNNLFFIGTCGNGIYKSDSIVFTSINNRNNNLSFEIFPNPASKYLQVIAPQKSKIEILNIEGEIIETFYNNEQETTIDLRSLSSGVYFIKVKTDKEFTVKKFVKQ